MALVDLFFDLKTKRLVRSITDEGDFRLPTLSQEDTLEINLWLYNRDYAKFAGAIFEVKTLTDYDLFISVGDQATNTVLASQNSFTKVNENKTFYGKLALTTAGITAALTLTTVTKTFEIRVFKSPDVYYRGFFDVTISKSVALAAAVTTPATSAALSQTEAAATYMPYELPAGRGILLTSEDGTQKGLIYMHNDGGVRFPGLT